MGGARGAGARLSEKKSRRLSRRSRRWHRRCFRRECELGTHYHVSDLLSSAARPLMVAFFCLFCRGSCQLPQILRLGKLSASPTAAPARRAPALLLAEDFLHITDLVANGTFHLIARAACFRIRIARRSSRFLFHDAFYLLRPPFDFIFGARLHASDSAIARTQAVNQSTRSAREDSAEACSRQWLKVVTQVKPHRAFMAGDDF